MTDRPIYYAWHGDQSLRDETIAKLHEHRAQERFIQGAYRLGLGENWKGCWYGCLTGETIDVHQVAYEDFGIHPCVGALIEQCYEHLPANVAVDTVLKLTESIPVGADLRVIYSRWICDWLAPRLFELVGKDTQVHTAIEGVASIFANDVWPAFDAASDAAHAAADAAAYAADAAADAAKAAHAAAYAAKAAYAAAREAAREAAYAACAARAAADAAARAAADAAADAALEAAYAAHAAADAAARAAADAATWQSLADWMLAELPKCPCPVMEVRQIDAEEIL